MRTVRLLPVVIVAAGALLALKTIGLVTNGGYALTGVSEAVAAGGGGAPEQGAGAFTLPEEQTLSDSSPTLADAAPTIGGAADEADHGSGEGAEASAGHEAEAEAGAAEASAETETANADCLPAISPNPAAAAGNCSPEGEAVPMEIDASGNVVPLVSQDGVADTERELLERLAERRAELDAYAEELELRTALIEAAEKRVEERAATMEALEAQIAALVEERDAAEESLITGVVSMYETMRARDAATIFNDLDMEVLVQVAKAMAPRKMAPILAEMDPPRAQELTVRLAAIETAPPDELTADQLSELPQIVGQ